MLFACVPIKSCDDGDILYFTSQKTTRIQTQIHTMKLVIASLFAAALTLTSVYAEATKDDKKKGSDKRDHDELFMSQEENPVLIAEATKDDKKKGSDKRDHDELIMS